MLPEIERRALPGTVELQLRDVNGGGKLAGYAAVFNEVSEDLGGFREVLRPGCFDGVIAGDILCRAEHDSSLLLGRTTSGTLRLRVDAKGLHYEVDLPDTNAGRDVEALARRGDIRGSSFAFTVDAAGQKWSALPDGTPLREIVALTSLRDVAPVAEPAYAVTSVSARSREEAQSVRARGQDLVSVIAGRPWAIHADFAEHVRGLVAGGEMVSLRSLAKLKREVHAWDDDEMDDDERDGPAYRVVDGVAVIPVIGTVTQRGDYINSASTRSTDGLAAEVREAIADSEVRAIVLEFDTPGGSVFGVPEAWEEIHAAGAVKPVVAHANSYAASAGYYLFSAATEGWVAPSGQVGSIGVYMLHIDRSRQIEEAGQRWSFISAGRFKVEGNPAEPLSADARAALQQSVDRYYEGFVAHVAAGRRVPVEAVRNGFGEGRMVLASDALAQRMVDRVGTLQQAIDRARELAANWNATAIPEERTLDTVTAEEWRRARPEQRRAFNTREAARGVGSFCCLGCGFPTATGVSSCEACRDDSSAAGVPLELLRLRNDLAGRD